ncbi:MAG: hypothetical protein RL685_4275 [Pseudomonadota bacterium]|jgi:hypothetical protein
MFRTVLIPLCLAALACTEFEAGSDELQGSGGSTDTRLGALTPEVGRDWSCIGALVQGDTGIARPIANAARLVQSLQVLSLAAGSVPPDVTVRACTQQDVGCVNPVTSSLPLNAEGYVDLPLYEGFDGYLEVTGPTIVSALMFYQYPLNASSRRDTTPLGIVEKAVLPMLTQAIGTPQDPGLGLLALRAFDCSNEEAPGVQYVIDRPGVPWYFVAGLPSGVPVETDRSGLGGFLNVAAGTSVVRISLSSGEREIALPKSLLSRPGWMTVLRALPSLSLPDAI